MITALITIGALFVATGCSYWVTHWLTGRAHVRGWVDVPDGARKIHDAPMPTAGGVGIGAGLLAGMGAVLGLQALFGVRLLTPEPVFWIGAFVMVLTGLKDDLRGTGYKRKFFSQCAVAYGLLYFGYGIDVNAVLPVPLEATQATLLSVPLTMLWVVGVMNAVNFIDGLDGLAGGVVVIGMATFGAIFGLQGDLAYMVIALTGVGAIAGFLYHNAHPASIFMGDTGSLLLGYLAAVVPLMAPLDPHPVVNLLIPAVVLGLPLLDTATTVMRRHLRGGSIFLADKDHIHHRLLQAMDEPGAVGTMYLAAAWFGLAGLLMAFVPPLWAAGVVALTVLVAVGWVVRLGYIQVPRSRRDALRTVVHLRQRSESPGGGARGAVSSGGGDPEVDVDGLDPPLERSPDPASPGLATATPANDSGQ